MQNEQKKVYEFHIKFNHPIKMVPRKLDDNRVNIRSRWMNEEVDEFIDAGTLVEQVDALIDLLYYALGTLVEMGVLGTYLEEIFDIVHNANMSKSDKRGPDTRTVKSDDWVGPEEKIREVLKRATEEYI